ncbi:MAG: PIN domain-containing protein [Thermoanaerobaculia bacterium]|nr:PIN domain-containing protein [Thermoanaerobaculia bacterium]
MASLVDTNVLVYRCDPSAPTKQRLAARLLRDGAESGTLYLAHQGVVEFVSALTRPRAVLGGAPLAETAHAHRLAANLLTEFPVLYPDRAILRTALQGAGAHQLSWFDAHMWAYAEVNGLDEILSEDFQHGRHYGSVRAHDPFLVAADSVYELPPLYGD